MGNALSDELVVQAKQYRLELIELLHIVQTGHPGGSLSCTEILLLLHKEIMHYDATQPDMIGRDRLVLSKGHAAPMLYINLAHQGFFPTDELRTLRQLNSRLQGHPCLHKTPGVELSTGPLGLGVGAALGMALSAKLRKTNERIYVLVGDGELQEGVVWESIMSGNKFGADNLTVIVDNNGVQLDGTIEEIMPEGDLAAKFSAFGWYVLSCDGHDFASLRDAFAKAKGHCGSPTVILAKTLKGKGVSFMEGRSSWHGKAIDDEDYLKAKAELMEELV